VYEPEEDEDQPQNVSGFLHNQTVEVVLDHAIDVSKAPFFGFDPDHATIFLKGLSKEISRYDIKALMDNIPGWKTITMSDPLKKAGFSRNCWIEFYSEDHCQQALLKLNGITIKENAVVASKAYTKLKKVKVLKNYPSTRLETDINTMKKLVKKLDTQMGI
jgi:hypothetical protein